MAIAKDPAKRGQDQSEVLGLIASFDDQISHLSFGEITKGALAFLADRLHVGRGSIAMVSRDPEGFRMFDATVDVRGIESGRSVPHGSASLSETVEQERAIYRPDIRAWPTRNAVDDALLAHGFRCTLTVPLRFAGRCIGTLNAATSGIDGIGKTTRTVIEFVAPRLAHALETGLALDALAESEARFHDVFETVGDGIIVADVLSRKLVMVNTAACPLFGRSQQTLLGLPIEDLHPANSPDGVIKIFEAMINGEIQHAMEIPLLRADGTTLLADVSARNTMISGKRCVVGVFRDATERRRLADDQIQMQKLDSIRTLAAGIAHDFNNLLTGLVGNVSLAQMHLAETDAAWQLLDEAQRSGLRATSLTRQLLTFAKGGSPLRGRVDIVQIVRDAADLATSGTNVECHVELPQGAWAVMGDEGQLTQVFQNLVRNAVDAMPSGGKVQVCMSHGVGQNGGNLCVEIRDQGPGIAPEFLDKIFLPFYSTKAQGRGLGLAVAYSIVQQHAGRIQVSSALGVGTTFRVTLPALAGLERPAPLAESNAQVQASGKVLVMDDDAIVLQTAGRILQHMGYDTQPATNGGDAVELYRQACENGAPFDAVILDLTVPGGMGGKEAAQRILAIDGQARLMVSSGYSDDSLMAEFKRHGFCAVLPKPYSAKQLREAVQRMLQEE